MNAEITHSYTYVISKVLHTALARPVGWCNRSDLCNSCEPAVQNNVCVLAGYVVPSLFCTTSLDMGEETGWSQISRSGQLAYINLLVPELFFYFNTSWIYNVNNTGTKYVRIMKQTAFWREKNGEFVACLKYSVPVFVE
jgi:hypothetical protein